MMMSQTGGSVISRAEARRIFQSLTVPARCSLPDSASPGLHWRYACSAVRRSSCVLRRGCACRDAAWSMKFTVFVPVGTSWFVNRTAACQFEIRRDAAVPFEIPLESKRIEACTVSRICRLEDEEHWDGIDGIFKASAKKSGKVRAGEDPSIAQAGVECAGVAAAAARLNVRRLPRLRFRDRLFLDRFERSTATGMRARRLR